MERRLSPTELRDMAAQLARRGPDGTGIWQLANVGLGHIQLGLDSNARPEKLPSVHGASGCVVSGDVRLDNRIELLERLRGVEQRPTTGDAELVLAAYLEWGEGCVERLFGDFAFAIWDPRTEKLFLARDQIGMRPLYYHHAPGRFFAFASEPRAILVLPQTPYRINEVRIADFLVGLEGIDKTSTFFEEVFRLPPAHTLTVTRSSIRLRRYWTLEVQDPSFALPSDEAYAEAFLEVFGEAVRCRLRAVDPPGSMLSGGMDGHDRGSGKPNPRRRASMTLADVLGHRGKERSIRRPKRSRLRRRCKVSILIS